MSFTQPFESLSQVDSPTFGGQVSFILFGAAARDGGNHSQRKHLLRPFCARGAVRFRGRLCRGGSKKNQTTTVSQEANQILEGILGFQLLCRSASHGEKEIENVYSSTLLHTAWLRWFHYRCHNILICFTWVVM